MSDHPYSRSGGSGEGPNRGDGPSRPEGRRSVLDASRQAQAARREAKTQRGLGRLAKLPTVNLGHRLPLAWMAELWERLWPRLWLPVTILAAFIAVALFDVLPDLSGWFHLGVLAGFAVALAGSAFLAWYGFRRPTSADAKRRLERESGLDHRPLTAIEDKLALGGGDPYAEALWRAHWERVRAKVKDLRIGAPRPRVARRDPLALRGLVLILLVFAGIVAWGDEDTRLMRAFMPSFAPTTDSKVTIEAWLTPPEYTGVAPRVVTPETAGRTLEVPDGTRIMIQLHGGRGEPIVTQGKQRVQMTPLDGGTYQAELLLKFPERLKLRLRGRNVVDWAIKIIPDKTPEIAWAKPPSGTPSAGTRIEYEAKDDYRLNKLRAFIARRGDHELIEVGLPVTGTKLAKGNSIQDLTAHRWAGLEVAIILEAEDDSGQRGKSEVMTLRLPERQFRHPVAREIIKWRKELTENGPDYDTVHKTVMAMNALAEEPDSFGGDPIVLLALRTIMGRLIRGSHHDGRSDGQIEKDTEEAIGEVQPLMWSTALRLEEGGLAQIERELRDLQKQLSDLLNRKDVPDKEIQKLLDQFQQALRDWQKELEKDMKQNPDKYKNRDQALQNPQDMQNLLDRLRDAINQGDKQALERMLSQLRQMMENQRNAQNQPGQRMDPNHPMMKNMRELGDIIRRQQELMDETFKRHQERRDGQRGNRPEDQQRDQELERQQGDLQKRLNDLMKQMDEMLGGEGQLPKNFGNAEREMDRAQRDLKGRRPGDAVGPQGRALDELRKGAQDAMRQLGQMFGMQFGPGQPGQFPPGDQRNLWGPDRDPLGRQTNGLGPLDTQDVKVPTEAERKRVRDILDELRRRAGEPGRPTLELDYIDRLLRRF
jgi:uncharacterized protein (TIGR02302 family)